MAAGALIAVMGFGRLSIALHQRMVPTVSEVCAAVQQPHEERIYAFVLHDDATGWTMNKSADYSKRLLWIAAGVVLLAALTAGWIVLPIKEWIEAFQDWIKGLGAWGVAAFVVVYIVAVVLLVPASALTLAAGLAFGVWGFPLVVAAATIGAGLAFLVARYMARDKVKKFVDQRPKLKAVDQAVTEGGWKIVGLLRLSPLVPFNLQNYLFGVTDIGFYPYIATTFLGIIPGSLLYVLLGALGHDNGKGAVWKWAFFAVGILATAITAVIIARKAKAKLAKSGVGNDAAAKTSPK